MYQCFHCLQDTVVWDADFDLEDFGAEGSGIVHVCHCTNCGAEIYTVIREGWIPCSERLPNTNGTYIVTRRISDGFECRNLTDACYFDGTSTWYDDTRVNHERKYLADVLAWMPLPMPYREDRNEDG